jgi:hypothetical protein
MIIQFVLSLGLAECLFYVISLGRSYRSIRLVLFAIILVGLVFVWTPDFTSTIAAMVGVGRGADLIMYLWIVLNLLLIVRLHIKLREQSDSVTVLARQIALNGVSED